MLCAGVGGVDLIDSLLDETWLATGIIRNPEMAGAGIRGATLVNSPGNGSPSHSGRASTAVTTVSNNKV